MNLSEDLRSEMERNFGCLIINFEIGRTGKLLDLKMKGIKDAEEIDIKDGIGFLDVVMRHPRLTKEARSMVREALNHLQSKLVGYQT